MMHPPMSTFFTWMFRLNVILFRLISILISFGDYDAIRDADWMIRKKRNQLHTFIFVKWMLNVWSEKKNNNQHRTWINQLTNHWKMLVFFLSDQRHAHRMSDENMTVRPDNQNNSCEKLFMLALGLDCWNSFVTTFYSIVVFLFCF